MAEFIDTAEFEKEFQQAMGTTAGKPTASLVVVNVDMDTDCVGTLIVDDVGTPSASKTVLVGRELGTGKVCKITVEYPEEENKNDE